MAASLGPTPQPRPPDDTYEAAIAQAKRDYARLLHLHSPYWRVDIECKTVEWACACDDVPRNAAAMDSHIINAVNEARGPVKQKKR